MEYSMRGQKKIIAALLCGMLGCVCMGAGDWLMIYGDTAHTGAISWLTEGVAGIQPWRNTLAMALAFPGIFLYGVALFSIACCINGKKQRAVYHYLTVFSLTPWLCLHLFYIMILYLFAWMRGSGYAQEALPAAEALFSHLSWLVLASEAVMLPPYLYWFCLLLRKKSVLPRWMALSNPLVFYGVLKLAAGLMADGPFRLAFTNGLMSESMLLWFASITVWSLRSAKRKRRHT